MNKVSARLNINIYYQKVLKNVQNGLQLATPTSQREPHKHLVKLTRWKQYNFFPSQWDGIAYPKWHINYIVVKY